MTQHATNGLTTLTQSKTNVGARWSRTLALGLEMHNNSTLGLWGPPMTSLPSRQIFRGPYLFRPISFFSCFCAHAIVETRPTRK